MRIEVTLKIALEERPTGSTDTYAVGKSAFGHGPMFSPFGPPPGTKTESVTSFEMRCVSKFVSNTGATLWESTRRFGNPYSVRIKEGESLTARLAADRLDAAARYFTEVRLPDHVYKAGYGYGFGKSILSYDGVVPISTEPQRPDPVYGYRGGTL